MSVRLGIDSSQSVASCAISEDAEIIASGTIEKPIENFPALIRSVFACAGMRPGDVDEIVVCIGPGSQTGIRTAVVTGNALALALKKPVSGVLSTDAAAILSEADGSCRVAVSAGRRRWYVEEYCREDGKLLRLDQPKLEDDLPEHTKPSFYGTEDGASNHKNCACGVLLVAQQQRQLISQSMVDEVRPFDF